MHDAPPAELSRAILEYWFGALTDASPLDRETEPFRTCYARWYGKSPAIDEEIRARFQPALTAVTREGSTWDQQLEAWRRQPKGLLALVLLLDQLPRNMFRDTPAMYEHDPLALAVTTTAIAAYENTDLSLVERMFLHVPLMHVENVTLQELMLARFRSLVSLARERSPHNVRFFELALGYAERHLDVVRRFGRFPHRNAILGRRSTEAEVEFLAGADSSF
jgi:uncharacterized protein (DUF924 family)